MTKKELKELNKKGKKEELSEVFTILRALSDSILSLQSLGEKIAITFITKSELANAIKDYSEILIDLFETPEMGFEPKLRNRCIRIINKVCEN